MKSQITIAITLMFWMIFTLILALSIIGWAILIPQINNTRYYKPQEDLRSTWMRIGYSLKNKLLV